MEKNNEMLIIRGLPGSGKSTMAKGWKDYVHLEADMWHEIGGIYIFSVGQLNNAHKWCQLNVEKAIREGRNVVVSNTFCTHKEIAPYFDMAERYEVPYRILCASGEWENVHSVPEEVLESMRKKWQEI